MRNPEPRARAAAPLAGAWGNAFVELFLAVTAALVVIAAWSWLPLVLRLI